jgi:hypothetical protein
MKTDLVSSAPKIVLTTLLSDKNVKVKNNRTKAQSEAWENTLHMDTSDIPGRIRDKAIY